MQNRWFGFFSHLLALSSFVVLALFVVVVQDVFKVSHSLELCTQGIDLAKHMPTLAEFAQVNGAIAPQPIINAIPSIRVGFCDAEGQGARDDVAYDCRLVSPILLASKVSRFPMHGTRYTEYVTNLLLVVGCGYAPTRYSSRLVTPLTFPPIHRQ